MSRKLEPTTRKSKNLYARVFALGLIFAGASLSAQQFADALRGCVSCWVGVAIGVVALSIGLTWMLRTLGEGDGKRKRK